MKIVILFLAISTVFATHSMSQQTLNVDSRLSVVYNQDYINNLIQNNPQELEYLNWYLDNSYAIIYPDYEKLQGNAYLKSFNPITKTEGDIITNLDYNNINVFYLSFVRPYDKDAIYRIGDTGDAIVFFSSKKLAKLFNQYQKSK
ncbi:MAG TPA: hypothetical protein PKN32_04295 [Bacteroidales bacterium]|nr:hypothetical protein [Bacteroidales bacterium]